jgi:hypothetical protein
MSLAAGAILVGAGHGAGHLIHSALDARGRGRAAYFGSAAAVLVIGMIAVIALTNGRDANTKAADDFTAVGIIQGEALRLDQRAEDLLAPPVSLEVGEKLPQPSPQDRKLAERLQGEANAKRKRATRLEAQARDERTLSFIGPLQILGLAVGAVGGFFFAAAAPVREYRRLIRIATRSERRAGKCNRRATKATAKAADVEAAVGRLGDEEDGWREVSLGHHEQQRLLARGIDMARRERTRFDMQEQVIRALDAPNREGGGQEPVAGQDSEE